MHQPGCEFFLRIEGLFGDGLVVGVKAIQVVEEDAEVECKDRYHVVNELEEGHLDVVAVSSGFACGLRKM